MSSISRKCPSIQIAGIRISNFFVSLELTLFHRRQRNVRSKQPMATTATLGEHMRSRRKHIMAQGERESAAGKQKWRRACISLPSFLQTIVLFSAVSCAQSGEVPGTDACTCSPPEFTFTLDFEGNCGSNTVVPSSSISRVQCSVTDELFQPVNDEVPIVIDEINVLEFGINLALLSDTAYLGPYTDGDDFDFTRCVSLNSIVQVSP